MRRLLPPCLCLALALAGVLAAPASAQAAESSFAGTWKTSMLLPQVTLNLWLVQVEDKDGKPTASVVASALGDDLPDAKIELVRMVGDGLHLTINAGGTAFPFILYAPKGEAKPKELLGSVRFRGQQFARFERTEDKEIDAKAAEKRNPAMPELVKATRARDAKEREEGLKKLAEKQDDPPIAYQAGLELLTALDANTDVRAQADKVVKQAGAYGPEMKLHAMLDVARKLTAKSPAVAVDYARQAEKGLAKDAPAAEQVAVLKTLAAALKKAEPDKPHKDLTDRLAKLNDVLDQEFLKTAVPFKPDRYAGRTGKSERVVLVELFTGAECPPCVSADVAFDALLDTYKPNDVVLLEYHLHIPGPDPLTNADSEKRAEYYGIEGTPSLFVDGKEGPAMGGFKQHGKDRYDLARKAINKALEADAAAKLQLTAQGKGGKIAVKAEAGGVKGEGDVRLRLVLVEDVVRYLGGNRQRLHHHVVRGFPGGVEGVAVKDGSAKQDAEVDRAELTKALTDYLEQANQRRAFPNEDRPLDLKHLKLVAFLQDDKSKEILQAVQVELPEAK